jgi:O-antigen ligase
MHKNQILQTNRFIPVLEKIIQFSLLTFAAASLFSISITQISFTIGSLSWLLKVHLTKTWKELRGTMVGVAILCFCLACILSITTSVDMTNSVKLLKKLIQFVIFFWVANSVQEEKQRSLLVVLVIVSGAAVALGGLTTPLLLDDSYRDTFKAGIKGTLSKQSTYSGVLMMAGLMALARCLFHKPKAYWVIGSIGLIAFAILCSLARQTWLGFFIGTVFLMFVWNKKYLLVLPLILLSLFLLSSDGVKKRILSLKNVNDLSLQHRIAVWESGWEIFKDYPLTGCGYKCVDSIYPQYPRKKSLLKYYVGMHSNIFQLLVDTGIVGFGAWIFIWITYFIEIFKRFRGLAEKTYRDSSKSLLIGPAVAVLSFLIGGFFETNFYDSEIAMLLYFIMGLSLAKVKNGTLQKISS